MKKIVFITLLLPFFFGYLTACSPSVKIESEKTDELEKSLESFDKRQINKLDIRQIENLPVELKRIHEKGKLEVAIYREDRFPYFFLNDNGELIGSDIEMAYDIAYQLGIDEVEFNRSAQTYDEIINLVSENKVDMAISKVSVTLNRAQNVLFSESYITLKQAVLVNRLQYSSLKKNEMDLMQTLASNQVKIGVVTGTSYMEFAYKFFSSAEIIPFENKDILIEAVQNGEIVAAFYDEFEFKPFLNEQPEALIDLQLFVIEDRKDELAIALPPDSSHLQEWLKHYFTFRLPMDMDHVLNKYSE